MELKVLKPTTPRPQPVDNVMMDGCLPADAERRTSYGDSTTPEENGLLSSKKEPRIAIIGAGIAGLCAARYVCAKDSGFTGVVFEKGSTVGGTWVYTDEISKDKYGQPIHSPLYYDLVTNLPKEVMEYLDFPNENNEKSYLTSYEVLDYLNKYAEYHKLLDHIKMNHLVKRVAPVGKTWSVSVVDLQTQVEHVSLYDAVMICSGPTSIPVYPQIDGLAKFYGTQLHSKNFRRGVAYTGKRVLIIGLGPSGLDITYKVLPHAKQVILCHNRPALTGNLSIPPEVILKPAAASMLENTVTFSDGSSEEVDVVIHCTGYTYNYPFLTKECGIIVDQYVSPLYLHLFNIENPTLGLFGVPKIVPFNYCVEYQVLAFLSVLRGDVELPSKEAMIKELEDDKDIRLDSGQRKKDLHKMGKLTKEYFESLRRLSPTAPQLPEVRYKIFFDAFARALRDFANFRTSKYKIVDDDNFEVETIVEPSPPECAVVENPSKVDNIVENAGKVEVIVQSEEILDNRLQKLVETTIPKIVEDEGAQTYDLRKEIVEETRERVVESSERTQIVESSTTTIQLDSMDELRELLSKLGAGNSQTAFETTETSMERVEKVLTKRTVQETVVVDGKENTTTQVEENVVENCYQEGASTVQKGESILSSDHQQLSEEMACAQNDDAKHR